MKEKVLEFEVFLSELDSKYVTIVNIKGSFKQQIVYSVYKDRFVYLYNNDIPDFIKEEISSAIKKIFT